MIMTCEHRGDRPGGPPTVSVVMATFNRMNTLPRAIGSVLQQTHMNWELLIVDDGSTDATQELLRTYSDARIRIFHHSRNRGVCAAKNTGLNHVRGEWFTTLDSDDEMTPEALEVLLLCAAQTGATAVTCNCLDAATNRFTGQGPTADGWLTPEETGMCRGDFWGLTRTNLLGDLRFHEGIPGVEATVWLKINRMARRYYLHRALAVVHTEGADRITKTQRRGSLLQLANVQYLRQKVHLYATLASDKGYIEELRRVNPSEYRRLKARIWATRVMRPFLSILPDGA